MIPRNASRHALDIELLIDAMMSHGALDEKRACNQLELSQQTGIPEGRIASPLADGERLGLFTFRVRAVSPTRGGVEKIWWLTSDGRAIGPAVQKSRLVQGLVVRSWSGQDIGEELPEYGPAWQPADGKPDPSAR